MKDKWQSYNGDVHYKVNKLAGDLQEWNSKVVGNIFRKKRKLLARISGIQKSLCQNYNPFLVQLEEELVKEYELLRDQEAMYW